MSQTNLKHLAGLILNEPLLCTPAYAETLCAVLGGRIGINSEGLQVNSGEGRSGGLYMASGDTLVIPVIGSMTHRATGIEAMSGMTSYAQLQAQVEDAMSDGSVKQILFDMDTPGGMVAGAFDFRDYLISQRGRKPMTAIARDSMASAGYLIGSATDHVLATQTSGVGSIGVVAMHVDQSVKNKKDGIKPTFIHAGAMKTAGNPHEALEGDALAYLQEGVNDSYEMFINAVAEARGLDKDAIRATEARVYRGEKAVAVGLADGVMSFDDALTELAQAAPRVYPSMSKGSKMDEQEMKALVADAEAKAEEATSGFEALKAHVLAEGYTITAEGITKEAAPEMIEVAGVMTDKASLPDHVVSALVTAQEEKAEAALTEAASTELPNFAITEAKALMGALGGLEEGAKEAAMKGLKAANAAMGSLMEEVGETGNTNEMVSATDKFNALVDGKVAEGMSQEDAKAEVTASPEGIKLIKEARKEA